MGRTSADVQVAARCRLRFHHGSQSRELQRHGLGGRRGWITGLGHRQPLNWPFELRYGRDEAKRLGKPASITGTITTPWRVVMVGPSLNALVNSTILPNLCPPPDPKLFADGIHTSW